MAWTLAGGGGAGQSCWGKAVEHRSETMALCEEGEDELRAGIAGSNLAEIGVICADRRVTGRDLRPKRNISGERRISAVTGSSLGIISWVGKKNVWKEERMIEDLQVLWVDIRGSKSKPCFAPGYGSARLLSFSATIE